MKCQLEENKNIPAGMLAMMAVMAGLTVANLYYNQPLLGMIRHETGITEVEANLITVISQLGYALGLCFIIPMGDLFSRRKIVLSNMVIVVISALVIAFADSVWTLWGASLLLGSASVTPQIFIPIAGQYSCPKDKERNMGIVLSGMLTGILASRVVSGFVGEWLGWRAMFLIAAGVMFLSIGVILRMLPDMKHNFSGSYAQLMSSVWRIVCTHPHIRLNAIRSACGFGSMLAVWSCLSFHLAQSPFNAGSNKVGLLGICGIGGALAASGMGKYIPHFGVWKFSLAGALIQIVAWTVAWLYGDTYGGLIVAILFTDIGLQCQQLSNQSSCIKEVPEAANRANTIFMTTYFIGGSLGTFFAGLGWSLVHWSGVCIVGLLFACMSVCITLTHPDSKQMEGKNAGD